jgi:hypothetical protein
MFGPLVLACDFSCVIAAADAAAFDEIEAGAS